jgi:O-methyltransferase domain
MSGTDKKVNNNQLIQMGAWNLIRANIIHTATQLNIADHIAAGHNTAEKIARVTNIKADSLYRIMRALAMWEIFHENEQHQFTLTTMGEGLRSTGPQSVRDSILFINHPLSQKMWECFAEAVQHNESPFFRAHGLPMFDFFSQHQDYAQLFNSTMQAVNKEEQQAVAKTYDFSKVQRIVDVGGNTGDFVIKLCADNPKLRATVFDLPHVADAANEKIRGANLQTRIDVLSGSFFETAPSGGDLYLLSHVLHDWTDEECITILKNCCAAMATTSKLLIIESVIPGPGIPHYGKVMDVTMLVYATGKERTEQEFRHLCEQSGFRLSRVIATNSNASIVEVVPL